MSEPIEIANRRLIKHVSDSLRNALSKCLKPSVNGLEAAASNVLNVMQMQGDIHGYDVSVEGTTDSFIHVNVGEGVVPGDLWQLNTGQCSTVISVNEQYDAIVFRPNVPSGRNNGAFVVTCNVQPVFPVEYITVKVVV